jgi:mono/diheme cytochrome c family protein
MKILGGGLLAWAWVMIAACGQNAAPMPETRQPVADTRPVNEQGKKLFYTQCASCHMVNKEMTGPALRGVQQRWPDKKKLYAFIRNSQQVIATDAYSKQLWKTYNETLMPPHPDLTDKDIDDILEYIDAVSVQ